MRKKNYRDYRKEKAQRSDGKTSQDRTLDEEATSSVLNLTSA